MAAAAAGADLNATKRGVLYIRLVLWVAHSCHDAHHLKRGIDDVCRWITGQTHQFLGVMLLLSVQFPSPTNDEPRAARVHQGENVPNGTGEFELTLSGAGLENGHPADGR